VPKGYQVFVFYMGELAKEVLLNAYILSLV